MKILSYINIFIFLFFLTLSNIHAVNAASHGMVVSEQRLASQIGVDILRAGGNAIDAAVAVGYALAVVDPCCGNIGGGGFMTIHLANGNNIFINFREKASLHANKNMFVNPDSQAMTNEASKGYLAVAVPGTVMGLETVLQKYGTLSRQQVMAPAIQLAKNGFIITPYEAARYQTFVKDFREQANVAAIFLKNDQAYPVGSRLIQTNLATTLQQIADKGSAVFYKGAIAKTIVNASNAHGGILTLKDFATYTVQELTPIYCNYRGYTIISAPPPSSGGVTLCEILNILENFPLANSDLRSATNTQYIIEAMHYGFFDRNNKLGDPDWIKNPVAELTSTSYAANIAAAIQNKSLSSRMKTATTTTHELTDTTHYSVIDNKGNAVAVTYTLNGFFGAEIIASNTGFFLNNEMDDFTIAAGVENKFGLVQHDANAIAPGKRPLSSMAPTIVMKDGKIFLILGSPGGPRIITSVLLTLLNVIDGDMPLQQAVDAPRFHYQVQPDVIDIEPFALPLLTQKQFTWRGYHFTAQKQWGAIDAIMVDPATGEFYGVNDIRRPDGGAVGY